MPRFRVPVVPLVTLPERHRRSQLAEFRSLAESLERDGLVPSYLVSEVRRVVSPPDRVRDPEDVWKEYVMLQPFVVRQIRRAIRALPSSKRPRIVRECFDTAYTALDWDTGQVLFSREELAAEIGCSVAEVSRGMGVLVEMGVIKRELHPVPGRRGSGVAVYFLNGNVGWKGDLEVRRERVARADHPVLRLV